MSAGSGDEAARAADRRARLAAQTVFDRPLVVEAGAGTGKTATLVARILGWCVGPGWECAAAELAEATARHGQGRPPEGERIAAAVLDGVVAITFTEAAAVEMATRVGQALAEVGRGCCPDWLDGAALAGDAGARAERARALLAALDHLTVCTIHAFCRRLLASHPLESGVHPAFAVDADGTALAAVVEEVVEKHLRVAFAEPPDPHLLALAAAGFGPGKVADAVARLAGRGVPAAVLDREPLTPATVSRLRDDALAAIAAFRAAGGERLRAAAKRSPTTGKVLEAIEATVAEVQELDLADLAGLDRLCAWAREVWRGEVGTRVRTWAGGEFNGSEAAALGAAAAPVAATAVALEGAVEVLCVMRPLLLEHARRALAPLLAETERELRGRGIETFDALLCDARNLLLAHPEVAARERRDIHQLLVDEFQDTDGLQCQILESLALGGAAGERPGLFLVGDPKQSIYGWRDADLAAYESFVAAVRDAGGEKHTLAVNFRSHPAILAEVERCVAPAMRPEPGVQPPFEPLAACEAMADRHGFTCGRWAPVEFWVSWDDAADGAAATRAADATEIEALALARDLRALHDEAAVSWRDIGVLLRTGGDLDEYLRSLRDADVPYEVERDRSYYQRREIIEAAALLRAVLDPADHLALVTWLRSVSVGVPDAAFIPLWTRGLPALLTRLGGPDAAAMARVRQVAEEVAASLPSDIPGIDGIRGWEANLIVAAGHLALLRQAFAQETAADFVERLRRLTLIEAIEAARTLGAFRVANLDRFFRTILSAIEASGGDPQAVLRALRAATAEGREAEEARPRETAEDAVRVMTIHKAKGLDFEHVYLMQTHKTGRPRAEAATTVEEVDGAFEYVLLGAPTAGWVAVEERRRRVADAERVRTLYVAVTRAKQRLVVSGNWYGKREAGSHVELLHARGPDREGLGSLLGQARASGTGFVDSLGARWVFPMLLAGEQAAPRPSREAPALPSPEEVGRQAALLAGLGRDAAARMARRFSAPASEEAHRLLRLELAEEWQVGGDADRAGGGPPRRTADGRLAMAVGSAVHRAMETLDLAGDLDAAVARERARLAVTLAGLVGADELPAALERAWRLLDRLPGGAVLARLREIAPHVVARELAVLLPPGERPDAPVGFISGAIDLVYRDPRDGELVIVDYKTDALATEAEVAARAAAYAPQGTIYRRALQQALDLRQPPRFELWFLHADRIVSLA